MREIFLNSAYFGVVLSISAYFLGSFIRKKTGLSVFNPLLIAIIISIVVLVTCKIDYQAYNESAKYMSYLLTPATVSLAVPLYEQLDALKKNTVAIILGIASGVLTGLSSILAMGILFGFTHEEYVTFLPKSITTAIGIGVSEELGGFVSVTAAVIIITGVLGSVIAEPVLRLFRIKDPVAKGIAIGSASHAVGTSKAMEIGKTEGAMSSLSIVVSGIMTVIGASFFAGLY